MQGKSISLHFVSCFLYGRFSFTFVSNESGIYGLRSVLL